VGVRDDPAELRLKAEACRKLAGMFEEPERKALWIERAGQWEQLAIKSEAAVGGTVGLPQLAASFLTPK
jgi:hypothetical protein